MIEKDRQGGAAENDEWLDWEGEAASGTEGDVRSWMDEAAVEGENDVQSWMDEAASGVNGDVENWMDVGEGFALEEPPKVAKDLGATALGVVNLGLDKAKGESAGAGSTDELVLAEAAEGPKALDAEGDFLGVEPGRRFVLQVETDDGDWNKWDDRTLAELDPALEERFRKVEEESGVDFGGLMWIAENRLKDDPERAEKFAQKMAEYSDENLVQLADLRNTLGQWPVSDRVIGRSSEELTQLYGDYELMKGVYNEAELDRTRRACKLVLATFVESYDAEKVGSDETVIGVAERTRDLLSGAMRNTGAVSRVVRYAMEGGGLKDAVPALDLIKETVGASDEWKYADVVTAYLRLHGMDEGKAKGFAETIFPLVEAGEPEVGPVMSEVNSWGMDYGDYGLSDYTCECFVSEINPQKMNELLLVQRMLPTSDFRRLEMNRVDAVAIQGTVIGDRSFIHDERPGVHELLSAMVDYYDARDGEDFEEKQAKLQEIIAERKSSADAGYYDKIEGHALDLRNYDLIIDQKYVREEGEFEYNAPVIEILRRLVENTDQQALKVPETKDAALNEMMQGLEVDQNARTGEAKVDFRQAGRLVKYVNEQLIAAQGNRGIWPSQVEAVAFTEKVATLALRGISEKDRRELFYDEDFKEMVRFRDLTASEDKYDEREFGEFWRRFSDIKMEASAAERAEHYKMLQKRVLAQMNKLAERYNSRPGMANMVGMLWSGNLNHEMIGLREPRAEMTLRQRMDETARVEGEFRTWGL